MYQFRLGFLPPGSRHRCDLFVPLGQRGSSGKIRSTDTRKMFVFAHLVEYPPHPHPPPEIVRLDVLSRGENPWGVQNPYSRSSLGLVVALFFSSRSHLMGLWPMDVENDDEVRARECFVRNDDLQEV